MFFALFSLVISDVCEDLGETNCPLCLYTQGCGYCRDDKRCYNSTSSNFIRCKDKSSKKDVKCVRDLGGDAIPMKRYIIGAVIIVLTIIIDLSVRCSCKGCMRQQPIPFGGTNGAVWEQQNEENNKAAADNYT
ncbi:hypothetical protein GPJ56_002301 [Histomonas meleagridis]|uniref:uncharacterized protein n=1 Tax=Histomonas meleagridis TaxID=135588 RepID=UPI003559D03C|nr:hypothetical protein GPJ56_002301 [Histomonas meleagridis]KAH0804562.1 hypothetical protein GO595_003392 [Histomonas meleagridis]